MPLDRKRWKTWFALYGWPDWHCTRCQTGVFQLERTSISERETADSRRSRRNEDWDPDWITNHFTASLKCSRAGCGEIATVAGVSGVQPTHGPEGETEWESVYSPKFIFPMPDIISLPPKCPTDVAHELRAAFVLYWIDSAAAANRLRIALELLLDSAGVKRRRRVPGAIQDLSLHQRIVEYSAREPVVAAHLMAIKWLGNTASHESDVSQEMMLDALEIFEHVLEEMVEQRSRRVAELAKKMTKEHAPRKKRAKQTGKRKSKPDA